MKFYCDGCRKERGGRYQIACTECCGWRMYPVERHKLMPQKARDLPRDVKGRFLCAQAA